MTMPWWFDVLGVLLCVWGLMVVVERAAKVAEAIWSCWMCIREWKEDA